MAKLQLIARSDMIHRKTASHRSMESGRPGPLEDALDLQVRVRTLKALLELQRWQVEVLNDRLYSSEPGGIAARRLLDLKRREAQMTSLPVPKGVNNS
jgi:hypothetical protein